jgi:hypothetical protein
MRHSTRITAASIHRHGVMKVQKPPGRPNLGRGRTDLPAICLLFVSDA